MNDLENIQRLTERFKRQMPDGEVYQRRLAEEFELILKQRFTEYFFCLLYTSPSPRDATLSRMPSSA